MVQKKDKLITERKPGPKRKPQLDNPLLRRRNEKHPAREILEATSSLTIENRASPILKPRASPKPDRASNLALNDHSGYPYSEPTASPVIKPSKDYHYKAQLNVRIDAQVLQSIKVYCAEHRLELHRFIIDAASRYMEENRASNLAHDDMMIFTTIEDIIMRYQSYTLQKWSHRDDRVGKRYNRIDLRLIDIGIITTIEKKLRGNTAKQPIKSFNYFTQEIDLLLEQQRCGELPAALDEYHKYVLSTWEKRIRKVRDEKWGKA